MKAKRRSIEGDDAWATKRASRAFDPRFVDRGCRRRVGRANRSPTRGAPMLGLRIACRTLTGLALLSCRAPSTGISHNDRADPVALVSPDTGPSPLQGRLAAQSPAIASVGEPRLDAAIDAFHDRTRGHRGYLAV